MAQILSRVDKGEGPALVLLHGFPLDRRMWEAQVAEFSADHRLIAPDFRGFGQSASTEAFTMESLGDDVHELLVELNALPCVLAGLSMGGYVAIAYALKYPSDLRGLILVDTRAAADNPQQREGRQKMLDLVRREGAKAVAAEMLPKLVAPDVPKTRPAIAKSVLTMMENCPPLTIEHALVAMRDRPDRLAELPRIAAPTLIIVGDVDAITPVSIAQEMHKQMPKATLAVIRGSGHMSPMEQPAQVNQAIRQFKVM